MAVSSISCSGTRRLTALLDVEQLHLEHQRRVRRDDAAGAARAVAELRRDGELALAADLHAGDAFVPSLDHVALPEREDKRLAAVKTRVEFRSLVSVFAQPAGVMHADFLAGRRAVAGTCD